MKKNVNINPPLSMSEALGKMCKSMKLSKPYVSDAQRKKFHAMENRGEISHATVKEFDEASRGKKLPEHVSKAELEKFDQELAKSWGKAEGAPAPASMPAPPKPKMSQPKMPSMKAPGAKAPSMKMPQMQMSAMKKDDKPHAAGSPEASAHEVVEHGASLPKMAAQMNRKGHAASDRFFSHLRTLRDRSKLRSPENVMKSGDEPGKKYVTVSQHWASGIHDKASGKYANPVKDAGKSRPEHMNDLHALKAKGHISGWGEHDKPVKHWGSETYEKHPDGKLKFVHADYDTSD